MVVLSARALNEELFIVSRLNKDVSESKLITAGAHRVISPYGIGGRRMAQLAVRPNVVEFLEIVMHDEELELWLEDLTVGIESQLDGVTVGDSRIPEHSGANVLAIRQGTGKLTIAPLAVYFHETGKEKESYFLTDEIEIEVASIEDIDTLELKPIRGIFAAPPDSKISPLLLWITVPLAAVIGTVHQLGWLASGRVPLLQSSWGGPDFRARMLCNQLRQLGSAEKIRSLVWRDPAIRMKARGLNVLARERPDGTVLTAIFPRGPADLARHGIRLCSPGTDLDGEVVQVSDGSPTPVLREHGFLDAVTGTLVSQTVSR